MVLDTAKLIGYVGSNIHGRICYQQSNCDYLLKAVCQAGDGDHLEIGTLHGGSAILVALAKQSLGLRGNVICIDPLDGYYKGTKFEFPTDYVTRVPVTREILEENLEKFGVIDSVQVIQAKSVPFPDCLALREFASAYIDGDHWGEVPYQDWLNVSMRTRRMVVFDNVDSGHPAVEAAVEAACRDDCWRIVLRDGITAVMERR